MEKKKAMSNTQTPEEQPIPEWFRDELNDHTDASYSEEDYKQDFIAGAEWGFERAASKLSQKAAPGMRWVDCGVNSLPAVGKTAAVRHLEFTAKPSQYCYTWIVVKNGIVHIDVDSCEIISPTLHLFLQGWQFLEETPATPSKPIEEEKPEEKDTHFPEKGKTPNTVIRAIEDYVYLSPIPPYDFYEENLEKLWFEGIRSGAEFMYNHLAGLWSNPAEVLQTWCKRVEERNKSLQASLASITVERDTYRKALEEIKEAEHNTELGLSGKGSVSFLISQNALEKYPSPTNTEQK